MDRMNEAMSIFVTEVASLIDQEADPLRTLVAGAIALVSAASCQLSHLSLDRLDSRRLSLSCSFVSYCHVAPPI